MYSPGMQKKQYSFLQTGDNSEIEVREKHDLI